MTSWSDLDPEARPAVPATAERTTHLHLVRIASSDSRPNPPHPVRGEVVAVWRGETLRRALALVADLRQGDAYRCFMPRYALRALAEGTVLFEVVFCFRCQGLLIRDGDSNSGFDFDGEHSTAVELRTMMLESDPGDEAGIGRPSPPPQ